ncbi:MAG: hypothetical protein L0229_20720 [Blastocatellia bacterium]|nr:hypothetical protein [Blastocatellia bacterium]
MKISIFSLALLIALTATAILAQTKTVNFDKDKPGRPPGGFSLALTGRGRPGVWVVTKDETAPSRNQVLAQTDEDETSYRFPLCIFDALVAKNLDLGVKFKPIKGKKDQAAGIVWRYKDKDNYYIVRANALENNVVLYKVENGRRSDLPLKGEGRTYGKKAAVPSGQWSTLGVVVRGNLFEVYYKGEKLFEVEDDTFKEAGKAGLWTKADSVTHFDDLKVIVK